MAWAPRKGLLGISVALLAALAGTLAVYHRGLQFPFALDDYTYLFPAAGIDPAPWSWRRPLTTRVFYELGYALFGVDSTLPWHLTCFALHVGNALMVFVLARRFGAGRQAAWLASALFATSPIAFTVLYWVAGIQELASAFFFLAATWMATHERRWRWFAVPLFAAAVSCKESVLAGPLVLPLLLGRRGLGLAAAQLGTGAALFLASGLHTRLLVRDLASPYATSFGMGFLGDLATALVWLWSPWRPYPDRYPEGSPAHVPWAFGLLLAFYGLWFVCERRRRRAGAAGRAAARGRTSRQGTPVAAALATPEWRRFLRFVPPVWFVALLLPVLPLHKHFYAYYLYLPQVGFLVLFAVCVLGLTRRLARGAVAAPVVTGLVMAGTFGLGVLWARRNAKTHETLTLARSTVQHDSLMRYGHVSGELLRQIRAAQLPAGTRRLRLLSVEPDDAEAPVTGRPERRAKRRIRTMPAKAAFHDGKLLQLHFPHLSGGFVEAMDAADEGPETVFFVCQGLATLKKLPDAAAAYAVLALGDLVQDRFAAAAKNAARALALRPDESLAHLVLVGVRASQGDVEEARRVVAHLEEQGAPVGVVLEKLRQLSR